MSRLGDGPELGMTLLMPLFAHGWDLERVEHAFAGGRHIWILTRDLPGERPLEVRREGVALGDVAVELFEEAAPLTDWGRR